MKSRAVALNGVEKDGFDLCIIGGGATGAGCALNAQLRGLSTVLVEAGDFACAASSSSTKLIHGGVHYLEQAGISGTELSGIGIINQRIMLSKAVSRSPARWC
jgi:glycerol-3-phosphate dehydrogenase